MQVFNNEKTVILRRKQGESLGFTLRRALEDGAPFRLVEDLPTLHRVVDIVPDGLAFKASLRDDDRLIEINGQDVRSKSYWECAKLLGNVEEILTLKVIRLSEENTLKPPPSLPPPVPIKPKPRKKILTNHIPDFLKPEHCISTVKDAYNDASIIEMFEILKPHCAIPEGPLDPTFNTIVDQPLDGDVLFNILSDPQSPAAGLTPYVVDSLKRYHSLHDMIPLPAEALESKFEVLAGQLTKRLLLVQALETLSYDSQRFLCNFIRKNDLPIPLSYRIWNSTEKSMFYRVNFNCLMETLCVTDLRLLLQMGSPSACGLGKSSLIGYWFDDKRRESFYTEEEDRSWRDGCIDVLFANRYVIFDTHGKITDKNLVQAIQLYSSIQLIYLTEEDLQGDFLQTHLLPNIWTIAVVFDSNYDDLHSSVKLLSQFEERFSTLNNVLWTSAPILNSQTRLPPFKITKRNKRLRETFDQSLKQIESKEITSIFRSCFQIQSSFYQNNHPIELIFDVEKELDRLFRPLSDRTTNLLLVTPFSYQRSTDVILSETGRSNFNSLTDLTQNVQTSKLWNEYQNSTMSLPDLTRHVQTPKIWNEYHSFTISLLCQRTYIELLITEIYLEKWRMTYIPNLRKEQEGLREKASTLLRQLRQAERINGCSTEANTLRQQYEELRAQLRKIDNRLMNVDLTVGLLCDELFALWENIHKTQPVKRIEQLQSEFDLIATKLAELVYKGFALHVLRNRPMQCNSRLLRMAIGKLKLGSSVAVLTVIGEQSSAKSSLLNCTFGCNFRVSAGRCTIGLYLGLAYYKNTTILILDSEGLMSLEESGSIFDNQIVTLAVLSSNLVIINHKGEISSNLENLIGMSLYAKIQIQSSPFKPKLLFVLRDQIQRDTKIFHDQLNRLKENIQQNGECLQVTIDDELEMKHIVLLPGAFTEDVNPDFGIVQKWRTKTFAADINTLRHTVFESLEAQINETINLSKNTDGYFYLKLTTNWKSIDDLGEGLLRCQSLYELTVQNELKSLCAMIIAERYDSLQGQGNKLIDDLFRIENNDENTTNELRTPDWIQQTIKKGVNKLRELISVEINIAENVYEEQTRRTCFAKIKSQWKNVESSIKNIQQYLYDQLEIQTLEMALQNNRDHYREELFRIKQEGKTSEESIKNLNQRVNELESEIRNTLQTYKRNKDDLIKSVLDVYQNIIKTKNADTHRRSTYNLCPPLGYSKYFETVDKLNGVLEKYIKPFIHRFEENSPSPVHIDFLSPSIKTMVSQSVSLKQEERSVLQWFTNADDTNKNEQTLKFIFTEFLLQIRNRLDMSPLHLVYSDPKLLNELIEIIDYELKKIDVSHINRPALVQDLIIFILHLLLEKTDQRFESKYKQLLDESFNALHQVNQNIQEQIRQEEKYGNQGQVFRRILGTEIIREVERINRRKLIKEIQGKLNERFALDPTEVTRDIYKKSINSKVIDHVAILKLVDDPTHFCLEQISSSVEYLGRQFIQIYADETTSAVSAFMLLINDVVLDDTCVDTHVLYKSIIQRITKNLPEFQASRIVEIDRKIANPNVFQNYFEKLHLFDGESDDVLRAELVKTRENFYKIVLGEHLNTLIYRSIGCQARCPGCGLKCELPAKTDPSEVHHHSSQYHLPMAFHGWPRDKDMHPHLSMCYQRWNEEVLFREENCFSTPKDYFCAEAPNWYEDLREKSEKGQARTEIYPLDEHRRAWMAVRYKLLADFDLRDLETYHSGVYPIDTVTIPNDFILRWKSL